MKLLRYWRQREPDITIYYGALWVNHNANIISEKMDQLSGGLLKAHALIEDIPIVTENTLKTLKTIGYF